MSAPDDISAQLEALRAHPLPRFTDLQPDTLAASINQALLDNRTAIDARLDALETQSSTSLEQSLGWLEACLHDVDSCFSPLRHMHAVVDSELVRAAYESSRAALTEFYTALGQDPRLFAVLNAVEQTGEESSPSISAHDPDLSAALRHRLRDMRLTGAGLDADRQTRIAACKTRLSELQSKFSMNVLDASESWSYHITDDKLMAGLPDSIRESARRAADSHGLDGWILKLDFPVFYAVQRFAVTRSLRETFHRAWNARASDTYTPSPNPGPGALSADALRAFDNSAIMAEILAQRHELASLLGYQSFAHLSLATKMAESPDQVLTFLEDLADRAVPAARANVQQVQAYADATDGIGPLAAWDFTYYAERIREQELDLDQEALRPFFPSNTVLAGLFDVLHQLFDVQISAADGSMWHEDAGLYEVRDRDGAPRGYFYLDLFARDGKRGGAWMDECRSRHRFGAELQVPVAYLTCNFAPPDANGIALLTHDEVLTLFHETGHGIHHLLTDVEVPSVGGINGVAWDAVELPSQLLENWCWEPASLRKLTSHVETGEALDDATISRLRDSRTFMAGFAFVRQLEFALFDMQMHVNYTADDAADWIGRVLDDVRARVAVLPVVPDNRFAHAFTHVFGGGYAAGYYSYKWAELLSSDAFSRFEENGLFDRASGMAFRDNILARGGTEEASVLYERFRGRPATNEALVRHNGL